MDTAERLRTPDLRKYARTFLGESLQAPTREMQWIPMTGGTYRGIDDRVGARRTPIARWAISRFALHARLRKPCDATCNMSLLS